MPKRRLESNANSDRKILASKRPKEVSKIGNDSTTEATLVLPRKSAFAKYSSEPKPHDAGTKLKEKKKTVKNIPEPRSSSMPTKPPMATINSMSENFATGIIEEIIHQENSPVILPSDNVEDIVEDKTVNGNDQKSNDSINESQNFKVLPISENRSQVILGIKIDYKNVKVFGCGYIRVLKGCLDVLGHLLTSESEEVKYFAPVTHCALVFQPACYKYRKSKKMCLSEIVDNDNKGLSESFADVFGNFDVVLLLTTSAYDGQTLSGYRDIYKVRISDGEILHELSSGSYIVRTEKYFESFPAYRTTCDEILSYVAGSQNQPKSFRNPVILNLGGKNVGKSTFNRYLINRLLKKFAKVYYLECDIGQPEFTPSGFVSLSCVTSPILGPPFTHIQDPEFSVYFGNITAAGEPDRYIQSVKHVFDAVASANVPVIVNTMGWIRALGLNLLVDTVKIVQPTHVVQIAPPKQLRYMPVLNKSYGWLMNDYKIQDYNHMVMETEIKTSEITMYNPSDLRNLRLLSYLNELIRTCCERDKISPGSRSYYSLLCSLKPYSVKLSDVLLCVAHETQIPRTRSLSLFNASLVALSHIDEQFLKNHSGDTHLPQPPVCTSVGLGVVRGVNAELDMLYIISHLSESILRNVNCLTLGVLNIPECVYQEHAKEGDSLPPYVTEDFPFQVTGSSKFRVYRSFVNKTP